MKARGAPHRIYRKFSPSRGDRIPTDAKLRAILDVWLSHVGYPNAHVELTISNDRAIRKINREFRAKDKATDVLSFPAQEFTRGRRPALKSSVFGAPGRNDSFALGDLVISIPTARRQAREIGHSVQDEFYRLLAHGLLHLCGFDHERSAAEEKRMIAEEDKLLSLLDAGK